MIGIDRI
ncbi:hypothetical protein LINPERPRIM_LOCUS10000 [Linum perenne]